MRALYWLFFERFAAACHTHSPAKIQHEQDKKVYPFLVLLVHIKGITFKLSFLLHFLKMDQKSKRKGSFSDLACLAIDSLSVTLFAFSRRHSSHTHTHATPHPSLATTSLPLSIHPSLLPLSLYICPLILGSAEKLLKSPMKYV